MKDAKKEPPMTAQEEWWEFGKTAVIAVLLALVIRTFALEPFNIPSGSMRPTLEIGDYLFVNKPAYGYSRFSFPFGFAPIEGRVFTRGHVPQRGDVIVFRLPTNTSIDFIKRITGLPGDHMQMKKGRLYINGQMVPREETGHTKISENGQTSDVTEYIETLPGGVKHHIYEMSDDGPADNTQEYVVPDGHYFGMGDNRDNSEDSRFLNVVGYIPLENIVGRAWLIFFSHDDSGNIGQPWTWPHAIRYGRLLRWIGPDRTATDRTATDRTATDRAAADRNAADSTATGHTSASGNGGQR